MLHKNTISSNYNQNTNKKLTKIGLAYANFIKQNYIELKNQEKCANFQLETHFQTLQSTVDNISEVDISI